MEENTAIILLPLSILPGGGLIVFDDFEYNKDIGYGTTVIKNCGYQLEPALRMILDNSKVQNIIMILLCTNSTLSAEVKVTEKNRLNNIKKQRGNYTAIQYFFQRLIDCGHISSKYGSLLKKDYSSINDKETLEFKGGSTNIKCHIVRIKEDDELSQFLSIGTAINIIRSAFKENSAHNPDLYLIANGGLRIIYTALFSIVSLLRNDKIIPKHIYSTEHRVGTLIEDPISHTLKEEAGCHRIIEDSSSFDLITFVNGVNDFLLHGNVDFFETYSEQKLGSKAADDILLQAMRDIADGTQVSDVNTYEKGLAKLHEINGSNSFESNLFDRPEFKMFWDNIKNDYDTLLNEDFSYVDIIDHCRKKKLYQQALTFIESKIPEDIWNHKVLYVNDLNKDNAYNFFDNHIHHEALNIVRCGQLQVDESATLCLLADHQKELLDFLKNDSKEELDYKVLENNNLIAQFSTKKYKNVLKKYRIKDELEKEDIKNLLSYLSEETNRDAILNLFDNNKELLFDIFKYKYDWELLRENVNILIKNSNKKPKDQDTKILEKNSNRYTVSTSLLQSPEEGIEKKKEIILKTVCGMWVVLKMCRNKLNHGDERRFNLNQLDSVIEIFCKYCNYLYS